jgi:hypothetical protein
VRARVRARKWSAASLPSMCRVLLPSCTRLVRG